MLKARDIKRRIRSIQNMMQITRAMKMVSAAKLRRAQEKMFAARPYANMMLEVLNSLAARAHPGSHPLLAQRGEKKIEVVIITADKGLCGSFNSNIQRAAISFLGKKRECGTSLYLVGKKGRDFFRKRDHTVRREVIDLSREVKYEHASRIANDLMELFISGETDAIYLIYNEFKSTARQQIVEELLLPIKRMEAEPGTVLEDYIYEPSAAELFADLLPRHVVTQVYRALLESVAAEHTARMMAMDAATSNAQEMIDALTLQMNRVRQSSITTELIEIVYGAEALRRGGSR
ncbi:MAG: ATP synthase F1 subunit gamma [Acidobacteriota bacterium]